VVKISGTQLKGDFK